MSIGLINFKAAYSRDEDGTLCRDVICGDIDHVTICDRGAFPGACCWVAGTPVDRLSPEIAAASRNWQLGRIERDRKQAENKAMLKRYFAKIDADRQRPSNRKKGKPEPILIPEIPEAWRAAMELGLYFP